MDGNIECRGAFWIRDNGNRLMSSLIGKFTLLPMLQAVSRFSGRTMMDLDENLEPGKCHRLLHCYWMYMVYLVTRIGKMCCLRKSSTRIELPTPLNSNLKHFG